MRLLIHSVSEIHFQANRDARLQDSLQRSSGMQLLRLQHSSNPYMTISSFASFLKSSQEANNGYHGAS